MPSYRLRGKVWVYPGAAGWHFVTLPKGPGREIRRFFGGDRGWGSVPVTVTLGATTWRTSIFPDKGSGSYVLPLKAQVRKAEGVEAGKQVGFTLAIVP